MVLCSFKCGANADGAVDRAIGALGALLGGILDAEFDRIHADLLGQFINSAFHGEGRHGSRRRTVGGRLRAVDDDFDAFAFYVLEIVAGEGGHGAEFGPGGGEGAAVIAEHAMGGGDGAILLRTDFHVDGS